MSSDIIELYVEIRRETDRALLVFDGYHEVWLPKSMVEVRHEKPNAYRGAEIWLPGWFAVEKGLI